MPTSRATRVLASGLVLLAFAVCWRLVGPRQLGGSAAYVITYGNSMEPEYQEGDLVVLRRAASYEKGDIVGYQSASLDRTILHRIHSFEDGALVTKGDNNGWLDTDRPKSADVIGKAWLHIPALGKWLAKTRSPVVAAGLFSLIAMTFFLGKEEHRRRRRKKGNGSHLPRIALGSFTDQQKTWMAVPAGLLVVCLLLAVVAFQRPLAAAAGADAAFEHVGDFSYSAKVPESAVYPDGLVEPGRPIFRRVVDQLSVRFDYQLASEVPQSVSGEALMFARVSGATGWKKAIPVAKVTTFKGDEVTLKGTLDLDEIQRLSSEVQAITGVPESAQKIDLVARVTVDGTVGGTDVAERFAPMLRFDMDPARLRVLTSAGGELPAGELPEDLHQTEPSEVAISETEANRLRFLGMSLEIRNLRTLSLLGILLSILMLAAAWFRFSSPAHSDEASLIQAQYGDWLIPIEAMDRSGTKIVRIKSIESLVRLAELYERMILHDEGPSGHSYFVEEDGVVYCYSTKESVPRPPKQPSRSPRFSGRQSREERRKAQVEKLREELAEIEQEVLKAGPSEE
ncbi:MAG: signal peptidase I [Actinomycetota bacterium]